MAGIQLLLMLCACIAWAGPLDKWEWLHPKPTGSNLYGVAYGAAQFIAVGEHESILRSTDGTNWTVVREAIGGTNLTAVCWGNGTFVAVGAHGLVLTSTDGTNWSRRVPFSGILHSVTYGGGLFIAVGGSEAGYASGTNWILASPNGTSWALVLNVPRTSPNFSPLVDVTYGANGFVAVSQRSPSILFSQDGFTWHITTNVPPNLYELAGVTYADSRYVATGPYTTIRSTNGIHWSQSQFVGHYNSDVSYGNGLYVIAGNVGIAGYSTNASSWNSLPWGTVNSELNDITFGNGHFVAVGRNGGIASSANGSNWVWQSAGPSPTITALACGPAGCMSREIFGSISATANFKDWTLVRSNAQWRGLQYLNGWYLAVEGAGNIQASSNLLNWTRIPTPATNSFEGSAFGAGRYVFAGTRGAANFFERRELGLVVHRGDE